MRCPNCGKQSVIRSVTVRWSQSRGAMIPERGHFCTACKKGFEDERPPSGELAFQSVKVDGMTDALRYLQESADLVVVRHKTGVREVLF